MSSERGKLLCKKRLKIIIATIIEERKKEIKILVKELHMELKQLGEAPVCWVCYLCLVQFLFHSVQKGSCLRGPLPSWYGCAATTQIAFTI